MKSWLLEITGRENLHLVDVPQPEPGPEQILVRSTAISLNFRDKAIIDGTYTAPVDFPMVLGSDLAGEVVSVGAKVRTLKPGDQIVSVFKPLWIDGIPTKEATAANLGGPLPGVLAEYVLLSERGALTYPEYLTAAQASTLPIAAVTAWVALFEDGHLQSDETVLIQGSGGVSVFGLQLARAKGARVIATSRSAHKIDLLKQLGSMMFPGVTLQGVAVGSREHMTNMLKFLAQHRIEPVIDATYDFHALPDALDHLDHGPFGKVVLEVR